MTHLISLTIDGQTICVAPQTTILQAARQLGIFIPTICYHEHCSANALCRICVVEVEGVRTLVAACVAQVTPSMVVHTQTERVLIARRTILEILQASVDLSQAPESLALLQTYQADLQRFPDAKHRQPDLLDDNPLYLRDYARCILCWRCVQVCAEDAQYTFAINFSGRGYQTSISTFYHVPLTDRQCVFC